MRPAQRNATEPQQLASGGANHRARAATHASAFGRMDLAAQRRDQHRATAAAAGIRRSKMWLAAVLAILFWFAVPYSVPRHLPTADAATQATDTAEQFEGAVSREIAVPILGLCAAFMLWRYPVRGRLGGRLWMVACLYAGVVLASLAWSEDPRLTAKRLVVFALDCLFTYALARTLTEMEMALGAALAMFGTGVLSVLADMFLLHTFHPADPDYRLMGVMAPNHQGMNLVSCALCCAALMVRRPRWVPQISVVLGLTLAMLWITRARIGTILCLALVAFALHRVLRNRIRQESRLTLLLLMLLLLVPVVVFAVGRDAAGAVQSVFMMGRKDTQNTSNLSNRLPLWEELMDSVEEHPLLGFGYGAFWTEARSARISKDQGWPVPHAHNTYLDQVIALGVVGGTLYLTMMVSALLVAWRRYRRAPSSSTLLNAMLLTWLVLLNTSESAPLDPHMPTILVYAAVVRMCLHEGSVDTADPVPDRPIIETLLFPPAALPSDSPHIPGLEHGADRNAPQWRTPVRTMRRPA